MAFLSRLLLPVAIACAMTGALQACGAKPSGVPASSSAVQSLEVTDVTRGTGDAVAAGQYAVVQYTGWLYESSAPDHKGKEFDSSLKSGTPFRFRLGGGEVIKGWDQGVAGMQVGGKRRLVIPADLAYGDSGAGDVIPPGATLVFDVDLVGIQ
ncbi:MAG: FKBP-type peptidyl-prolyl cis-trans isomerase [Steroidobacteraceae bacterium]